MAALPLGLSLGAADASASPLDPAQTIIRLAGDLTWKANPANPPSSSESAGSFVRRVAGTPHYDGVIRSHSEPAIIAICGIGPVNYNHRSVEAGMARRVNACMPGSNYR
jgi:hypothetical protein